MKKVFYIVLATVVIASMAWVLVVKTDIAHAGGRIACINGECGPNINWFPPNGLPGGVSARELYLENVHEFNFNGQTYSPPHDWQTFAGAAYKLSFKGHLEEPIKICFYYPKANYSGTWHGQIHFLNNGQWTGLPTTSENLQYTYKIYFFATAIAAVTIGDEFIEITGTYPFLCTNATLPGVYIVVDYWTPD